MPFPPINNEKHITFRDIGMYHMNNDRKIGGVSKSMLTLNEAIIDVKRLSRKL